jgi:hypothetical protein
MDERMAAILEQEMAVEQSFEMLAAFGPGATVVDVITGKQYKTPGRSPKPVTGRYEVQRKISNRVTGYKNGKPQRPWDWHVVDGDGKIVVTHEMKVKAEADCAALNSGKGISPW